MRAKEFIKESTDKFVATGIKPNNEQEMTMTSAHRIGGGYDRQYDFLRLSTLVASFDGKKIPNIDLQSWAGKNNTAHPYTKIEADILKQAYKIAGIEWDDVLKPNTENKSSEPKETNIQSPVQPFKGYQK